MRWWHESVAVLGEFVPGGVPVLGAGLSLFTTIAAMLWYFWPDWLPGRRRRDRGGGYPRRRRGWLRGWRRRRAGQRPRWRLRWRLRWRWWRRRWRGKATDLEELPPDALPEIPAGELLLTADALAGQGRYKEAVRERLRAIVRDLLERGVLDYRPGWTVTELATRAGRALPATAAPLARASGVFSGIWYGRRPASQADDAAMRECAEQVRAALTADPAAVAGDPAVAADPAAVRGPAATVDARPASEPPEPR